MATNMMPNPEVLGGYTPPLAEMPQPPIQSPEVTKTEVAGDVYERYAALMGDMDKKVVDKVVAEVQNGLLKREFRAATEAQAKGYLSDWESKLPENAVERLTPKQEELARKIYCFLGEQRAPRLGEEKDIDQKLLPTHDKAIFWQAQALARAIMPSTPKTEGKEVIH